MPTASPHDHRCPRKHYVLLGSVQQGGGRVVSTVGCAACGRRWQTCGQYALVLPPAGPGAAGEPPPAASAEALALLRNGLAADGNCLRPVAPVGRDAREELDRVLAAWGGRWDQRLGGWLFEALTPAALAERWNGLARVGRFIDIKDHGFAETPPGLADAVIARAGLAPGLSVLEPSAGRGALARRAALAVGAGRVRCVEYLAANAAHLRSLGFEVAEGDFLALDPSVWSVDRVVMCPPWGRGADARHVAHAFRFLKPGGRLVAALLRGALARPGPLQELVARRGRSTPAPEPLVIDGSPARTDLVELSA